jgi:hypothetical protein
MQTCIKNQFIIPEGIIIIGFESPFMKFDPVIFYLIRICIYHILTADAEYKAELPALKE